MRISTFIRSTGIALLLLACGLLLSELQSPERNGEVSADPTAVPPAALAQGKRNASAASIPYEGPRSLEERILKSPVVARVRLDSVTTTAESGPTYMGTKHKALLEFNFSVLEYLKGSGADDIVAVWQAAPFFDTSQEAEEALTAIAAARDDRWDDREAIVFLQLSSATLASTQRADRYYLAWGGGWSLSGSDDGYSIASRHNRLWLPAAAGQARRLNPAAASSASLMDVPPATGTIPTITLGELKTRIAAVAAKLDAGDGSEQYRECVHRTYDYERVNRYQISVGGEGFFTEPRTRSWHRASAPRAPYTNPARMPASARYALNYGSKGKTPICSASSSATWFPTTPPETEWTTHSNMFIAWCRRARSPQENICPTTTTGTLILFRARVTPTATTGLSPSPPPKAPCTRRSSIQ